MAIDADSNLQANSSADLSGGLTQTPQPNQQGRFVTQDEMNKLVSGAREVGKQKGYERAIQEFGGSSPEGVVPGNQQALDSMVQDRVKRELEQFRAEEARKQQEHAAMQQQKQVDEFTRTLMAKELEASKEYPDYESVVRGSFDVERVPDLYVMANELPNAGKVLYELARDSDAQSKVLTSLIGNPKKALAALKEFSDNLESRAKSAKELSSVRANDPLIPMTGGGNSPVKSKSMGMEEIKSLYRA